MSEKAPVQITVTNGPINITLSAATDEEMVDRVGKLDEMIDTLTAAHQQLIAKTAVTGIVGSPVQNPAPVAGQPFSSSPLPGSAPVGQVCPQGHGVMVDKGGTSKKTGKPWKGKFCPADVDGCGPVWG